MDGRDGLACLLLTVITHPGHEYFPLVRGDVDVERARGEPEVKYKRRLLLHFVRPPHLAHRTRELPAHQYNNRWLPPGRKDDKVGTKEWPDVTHQRLFVFQVVITHSGPRTTNNCY